MKTKELMLAATLTIALTTPVNAGKYFVGITTPWTTTYAGHYPAATAANLITAVNAARANSGIDTIYVGIGRYYLTEELILSDVLLGGYQNGRTRYYPASDSAGSGSNLDRMTVLDGNSLRTTVDASSKSLKHRVATVNVGGIIEGCLIRNGHARSTTTDANAVNHGGGILVKGGSMYNCILRGNVAFNPAGSSFSYDSVTPLNSSWTTFAPAKGGGVYVDKEGGNVVNCLIYSNMDDLGLGIDCANSGLLDNIKIINNTIVNNANCPRMASLINTSGFKIMKSDTDTSGSDTAYTLSRYYMASTETTVGQYSCFLNAMDPIINGSYAFINANDLSGILSANAPLSGHTGESVQSVLSIGTGVATDVGGSGNDWRLCYFVAATSNNYGYLYYNNTSKIFSPSDAVTVTSGESSHNNDYACSAVIWYGGIAYGVWMGGMLPTVGQWYYGGCATDNNGGKATPTSHYPSPVSKTTTPSISDAIDPDLEAIAWYSCNSGTDCTAGQYTHQVGKKAPNMVGLYDVAGNLWEWCLDWYKGSSSDDFKGGLEAYAGGLDGVCAVLGASRRVVRGGSWLYSPHCNSLGYRYSGITSNAASTIGFRLAVVP